MSDTITIPATGTGTATPVVATDDAGAAGHVQIVKLALSADGVATALTADNTNGILSNPSDRALRDNGKVDVAALDQYTPVSGRLPVDGSGVTQPISGTVTAAQGTATNLKAEVVGTGTFAVQAAATLAAETTKVIGVVRTADGSGNLLTSTAQALNINVSSSDVAIGGGTEYVDDTDTMATGVTQGGVILAAATPTDGSVNANDLGVVAMSLDRRLHVDAQIVGTDAALTVDGSGVTQPVSGTFWQATQPVSAASLPLPTGAATSAAQLPDGHNVTIDNAAGAAAVNIQDGGNAITVDGSLTTVSTVTNLSQMGGVAISLNTGVRDTGTQRVTIATNDVVPVTDNSGSLTVDQPTGTNLHTVVDSGTITTVSTVTAVSSATLAAETTKVIGTVRCQGNLGAAFDAATAASVPANAILNGAKACITNPTAVTNAQLVGVMTDDVGRLVTVGGHCRDLVGIQTTAIASSSSETTVISAIASTFCDITSLSLTNATATAVSATLKDSTAGTTRAIYDLAASGGIVLTFDPPMPQATVNNNWTITLSSAAVTVHVNAVFVKNV